MTECFVLAGGLSKRFGEDKLLYQIGGKKVIEYTVDALRGFCERLCLVTKDREKFSFLKDVEILEDKIAKQLALAGVYTALENLRGDRALILAGDMPMIKREVVQLLLERAEPPITLFRIGGKLYPLFAVYYRQVLPELRVYLNSGGEKVVDFVERFTRKELTEREVIGLDPELLSFLNMNTKTDAEYILKTYGGKNFEG
ncbi:MAG: molybdenum cofactor guanylyltransferase MobA [Aquificaceae bacterium]|jgi:molybdopterin-guanine dinucleotide biosynthesis protein A|uniref:molybdenum cofactor guanylyltransferase MobA n=1 Tax=Hydrogenobacter sp. Uz 6-8 TaxID=3384828 RepID=UPI0030A26226